VGNLFWGDFRRLLHVIPGGTMVEMINASLSRSLLWPHFKIFTINENTRLSSNGLSIEDRDNLMKFSQWILLIGNGDIVDFPLSDDHDECFVKIPDDLLLLDASSDPISLTVSYVYPGIDNTCLDPSYFKERAVVTTKNATVDEINHFALSIVPGEEEIYLSTDSVSTTSSESDNVDLLYP
jgi:hypothetical protein